MVYVTVSPKHKGSTHKDQTPLTSSDHVPESSNQVPLSISFLRKKRNSDTDDAVSISSTDISPPRLVRKKSGELVKSSLKLNSLANDTKTRSKSMPTTPTYNKSVHFGNDVDVRYFDERERPTAISADASPILKARGVKAIFEVMDGGNVDLDDDEDSDDLDDLDDPLMITWKMEMTNFSKIKYNEKFNEGSKVFLEKLILDEDDNCLSGSIAAKNLSFDKCIHIRYTFDSWRTVIEIEANFTKEITRILKRSNYDRFTFKIPLSKFEMLNNDQTDISFCIRYRYGIEEVWDNNHHKNYHLRLYPSRKLDNNRSKKLNDYFSSNTSMDYFNNYQMLRSPETPNVLKNNESLLDTPEFGDLSDTFDISDSVNKLSLYSDSSNTDLLKYKDDMEYTTTSVPPHLIPGFLKSDSKDQQMNQMNQQNENKPSPKKVSKTNKPAINSKSYQELLDSYCFYKSGGTTSLNYDNSFT